MHDVYTPELPRDHVYVSEGKTKSNDLVWDPRGFHWEPIGGLFIGVSVGLFPYVCRRAP